MRTRSLASLLALPILLLAASCTRVENETTTNAGGITVMGVGSVQAKPDIALLTVGVEATDLVVENARVQAAAAMTRLIDSIKSNGVADGDIQTDRLSVRTGPGVTCSGAQVIAPPGQQPPISACVSNRVQVKIRNLDSTNKIVDGAIAAGGVNIRINDIQFAIDNPEALVAQAKTMAIEDARAKAEKLADDLDVKLGKLRSISTTEQTPGFAGEFVPGRPIAAPRTGGGETIVSVGLFDVIVTANLVFRID